MNAPTARAFWRRLGSMKARLSIAGVLLIAASVALTVWLVLREAGARTEAIALDMSLAQTRKLAHLMGSRVVELQLRLRAAAGQLLEPEAGDPAHARRWLDAQAVLATSLDTLFVADTDGRVIAWRDDRGPRTTALSIGDRAYFRATVQQARPVVSEPMIGRMSDEPVVLLTMPVTGPGGAIVAVIGGSLRLSSNGLLPDVTAADPDDGAHIVITDARGRILSHADRRWVLHDAEQEPALSDAAMRWAAAGRPIEPGGFSLHSGGHLVSMAGVPAAEWMVFRSQPAEQVLAGLQAARERALWIGGAVALAGGGLLLLVLRALLAPLRRLEARTRRMLDGDLADDEGWPSALGEIGQLSHVMRSTLRERAAAAASHRELLAKLAALMAQTPLGIAFTRDRRLDMVNGAFEALLGHPPGALKGQPTHVLYPSPADAEVLQLRIVASFRAGRPFDDEVLMARRDGTVFWGRLLGAPVRWGDAESGAVWTLEDVSHARSQREALSWVSTHDALTELVNRREFERRLRERLAADGPACALFIDLDHFKTVNDTAGHAAGDRVLIDVAHRLQAAVRGSDTVARLGGDEFAVLLDGSHGADALRIAGAMRDAIAAYRLPWKAGSLRIGASIGIVELGRGLDDFEALLAAADAACYEAKRRGRNQVCLYGAAAAQVEPAV